jgi:lipid II:glycine glycyltransferase (peptidoglycan interpeptide bridge formation enzyme)
MEEVSVVKTENTNTTRGAKELFIANIKEADLAVCENADSFLQSSMWGEFKSRFDSTAKAFLINWQKGETTETLPLLALCRRFAFAFGLGFSFAYIPWGSLPDFFPAEERAKVLAELAIKIKPFLSKDTAFIRFEPPWHYKDGDEIFKNESIMLTSAGFIKAAATVQPPDTVIVNLSLSCEEILASMKSKWRYNVSLAEKKGVKVKTCGVQDIEVFYNLLKETAARDGIAVHGINYYRTLFEVCEKQNKRNQFIRLYAAKHEADIIAAIVVLFRGKEATYLYGASSNNKRNLMAPYALQWKAMQDAKEAGCVNYDLFGIPPNEDPNHPMAGLYRFKTGFGGQIIHRPGSWDYRYKKVMYNLFNKAEALRKKLRDLKKKR